MKRFLWLTCMVCATSLAAACSSSNNAGKTSDDGGMSMTNDLSQLSKNLDDTNKSVDSLKKDTMDLGQMIDDVSKQVGDVGKSVDDLTGRVSSLENPDPQSCSVTESCIPDGIDLVQTGVQDLIKEACTYETTCCSSNELAYKFGPGIQSVDDCTQTFVDLVNNGFAPDFLDGNGPIIDAVVKIAQALNDTQIKITLDATAIQSCVADLDKRECNKFVDTGEVTAEHCTPSSATPEKNPCAIDVLVKGLQKAGESCGTLPSPLPSGCGDGLVCRSTGATGGICVKPAEAGQRCTNNSECDGDLFCNTSTGKCQARGAEGDDCSYVDTITNIVAGGFSPQNAAVAAMACQPGLTCDPTSKKCVTYCSEGAFCSANGSGFDCPDGTVCNVTEYPSMRTSYSLGLCRPPTAEGDPCTSGSNYQECSSGRCALDSTSGKFLCAAALKADGEDCTAAGVDALCESGHCGTDLKCATPCDTTTSPASCATGYYCDQTTATVPPNYDYFCEPLIADTNACGNSGYSTAERDASCSSGYCNLNNTNCAPKVAANAACTSGRDVECPAGQFCPTSGSGNCTDYVALNADCTGSDSSHNCGPGNYCYYNASNTPNYQCRVLGEEGDDCDTSGLQCDSQASPPVSCQSDNKCHAVGKYPDGVTCPGSDAYCESGWCAGTTCAAPLAEGDNCDIADATMDTCGDGLYCKYADGDHAGKCTARLGVGETCEPRFSGQDCLNYGDPAPGSCELSNGQFMCGGSALPADQVLCHGT